MRRVQQLAAHATSHQLSVDEDVRLLPGSFGGECGHCVNMSANYFTYAACRFSTAGGTDPVGHLNFH